MSGTKRTYRPWQVTNDVYHENGVAVVDSGNGQAAMASAWPIGEGTPGNEEAQANATLVASTRDLLKALKRLSQVAVWDEETDLDEFDAAMQEAESAIAGAEETVCCAVRRSS